MIWTKIYLKCACCEEPYWAELSDIKIDSLDTGTLRDDSNCPNCIDSCYYCHGKCTKHCSHAESITNS